MSNRSFADLGVSKSVAQALARRGITQPFPVQSLVIADVLAGEDVLVQSPTGSGKTLAFGAPMVDRIANSEDGFGGHPDGLVLAPTRELASQIVEELRAVCQSRELSIAPVYGGVGFGPQIKRARAADIVVATPGRLEDLLARSGARLRERYGLALPDSELRRMRASQPANPRAAQLYAEGMARIWDGDWLRARPLFQGAVSADPAFALAHAQLNTHLHRPHDVDLWTVTRACSFSR